MMICWVLPPWYLASLYSRALSFRIKYVSITPYFGDSNWLFSARPGVLLCVMKTNYKQVIFPHSSSFALVPAPWPLSLQDPIISTDMRNSISTTASLSIMLSL